MATPTPKKPRVAVDGVLLLDKPAGFSSNDALAKTKRLLNARKGGHTGTLDPFATGLLPLCFGEATKFAQDLLDADKTYEAVVRLGITTSTGDTEGEVIGQAEIDVTREAIEAVLPQFRGDIEQVPPMHSALKRDGKPLYEYARAGLTLEREARSVVIRDLDVIDYRPPFLSLRVSCSKGTYIRVLGEDIGRALGCGAHVHALRRTRVGHLSLEQAQTIDQLERMAETERKASLAPPDSLLSTFPAVWLPTELARRFQHGQRLPLARAGLPVPVASERVRVYCESDRRLLGTARISADGILAPERLVSTNGLPALHCDNCC